MQYAIRDPQLAFEGQQKIGWVKAHMPVLNEIEREFVQNRPFAGNKVAVSVHLEAKTAYLAQVLAAGGAEVTVTGSNPLSTQDDVAAALVDAGIPVFAWYGATAAEYNQHLKKTLENAPQIIIDDGGDLVALLHSDSKSQARNVLGGCEETTTGVLRLKAMEGDGSLAFPMFAVNDADTKHLFDNRYGTGESVWSGIMRTTNLITAGKVVVVLGYGWCGKGIARRAEGLAAQVVVCEVDPIRALEAHMDGYQVMHSLAAAACGQIFITATGCQDVLDAKHFEVMPDQAILANAGHFDVEISKNDLSSMSQQETQVRQNITEYTLNNGKRLYLLAEGRLVNLAAGDGHPAEIMDMSFALQALTALHILQNHESLDPKLYSVPREIDQRVAKLKVRSLGIYLDNLTAAQDKYLKGKKSPE